MIDVSFIRHKREREFAINYFNHNQRRLYYLEEGIKTPGWHLYRDICEICNKKDIKFDTSF